MHRLLPLHVTLLVALLSILPWDAGGVTRDEAPPQGSVRAQLGTSPEISARLVVGRGIVKAGGELLVGVHFRISPDWHIYWRYPGEIGLPTRVAFTLPEGFSTPELVWPAPVLFEYPGQPAGFGYSDEVLVWARIRVPEGYRTGTPLPFTLEARWLGCGPKACVPGRETFSGELTKPTDGAMELFTKYAPQSPKDRAPASLKVIVEKTGEKGESAHYLLRIQGTGAPVGWFPAVPKPLLLSEYQVTGPGEFRFALRGGVDAVPPEGVESLLVTTTEEGKVEAYPIQVPLSSR